MNRTCEDQRGSIKLSWQVEDDDHLYCNATSILCGFGSSECNLTSLDLALCSRLEQKKIQLSTSSQS